MLFNEVDLMRLTADHLHRNLSSVIKDSSWENLFRKKIQIHPPLWDQERICSSSLTNHPDGSFPNGCGHERRENSRKFVEKNVITAAEILGPMRKSKCIKCSILIFAWLPSAYFSPYNLLYFFSKLWSRVGDDSRGRSLSWSSH